MDPANELRDAESIRAHYGEPSHLAKAKQLDHLDRHCRAFIALSPFVVIATSGADGRADASPRGDKPGFVAVIDDRTLLVPDRTGNKRVDTMLNLTASGSVGLLFMVPGIYETLRVNGSAEATIDPGVLTQLTADGKSAKAALVVRVEEVFFQCGKALIRADLWNPERHVPRANFPSLAKVLADQITGANEEEYERRIEEQYRIGLY